MLYVRGFGSHTTSALLRLVRGQPAWAECRRRTTETHGTQRGRPGKRANSGTLASAYRPRRLHQMLETHDVLVSDAQKNIIPVPEHRPSVFPVYLSGVDLALELKFVAAEVDSIGLF
jgi:hypothetical protein